jgi:hypothetical protein
MDTTLKVALETILTDPRIPAPIKEKFDAGIILIEQIRRRKYIYETQNNSLFEFNTLLTGLLRSQNNKQAAQEWKGSVMQPASIKHVLRMKRQPGAKNVIAALILCRGAIMHGDAGLLRKDLHRDLIILNRWYKDGRKAALPPALQAPVMRILAFDRGLKIRPGGKLELIINKILTDKTIPLDRFIFGETDKSMSDLNPITIHSQLDRVFKNEPFPVRINATPSLTDAFIPDSMKSPGAYAPNRITVSINEFTCLSKQEKTTDEIRFGGNIVYCKNAGEIYSMIDSAVRERRDTNLTFQWAVKSFLSDIHTVNDTDIRVPQRAPDVEWLPKDIMDVSFNSHDQFALDNFYNGFLPWNGCVFCLEDDNQEYEAINEAIHEVEDCAEMLSTTMSCASLVLAAGGVTGPAAIAAAIAGKVADAVDKACEILQAFIDIINYYDQDDLIGVQLLESPGDYAETDISKIKKRDSSYEDIQLIENDGTGAYKMKISIDFNKDNLPGNNWIHGPFPRLWGFKQFQQCVVMHLQPGGAGAKNDFDIQLNLGTDAIFDAGNMPEYFFISGEGNYEFRDQSFNAGTGILTSRVHAGVTGDREFHFQLTYKYFKIVMKV